MDHRSTGAVRRWRIEPTGGSGSQSPKTSRGLDPCLIVASFLLLRDPADRSERHRSVGLPRRGGWTVNKLLVWVCKIRLCRGWCSRLHRPHIWRVASCRNPRGSDNDLNSLVRITCASLALGNALVAAAAVGPSRRTPVANLFVSRSNTNARRGNHSFPGPQRCLSPFGPVDSQNQEIRLHPAAPSLHGSGAILDARDIARLALVRPAGSNALRLRQTLMPQADRHAERATRRILAGPRVQEPLKPSGQSPSTQISIVLDSRHCETHQLMAVCHYNCRRHPLRLRRFKSMAARQHSDQQLWVIEPFVYHGSANFKANIKKFVNTACSCHRSMTQSRWTDLDAAIIACARLL